MPLQLNCPKCPQRMEFLYTTSDGSVLVYRCAVHGEWRLGYEAYAHLNRACRPRILPKTG
jgi:hypothetical protein